MSPITWMMAALIFTFWCGLAIDWHSIMAGVFSVGSCERRWYICWELAPECPLWKWLWLWPWVFTAADLQQKSEWRTKPILQNDEKIISKKHWYNETDLSWWKVLKILMHFWTLIKGQRLKGGSNTKPDNWIFICQSKSLVNCFPQVHKKPHWKLKAPFSIATTLRCYSILWIASLYPWCLPYNAEC